MSSAGRVHDRLLDKEATFQSLDLGLDKRLTKGLALAGFIYPTLVQSKAIPLAMQGKDLLVRAKTGSGKTIAYALPLLNIILGVNSGGRRKPGVKAIVLVPTRELCVQTQDAIGQLCRYCRDVVTILALSHSSVADQAAQLLNQPDILISTPGRLAKHLKAGNLTLKDSLKLLVVDEADLVLSFGGTDDVRSIVPFLPKICQSFLMSATLSSELDELKRLVLHSPAVLRLEGDDASGQLTQFFVNVPSEDRYLVLYALLRLELISGKALFFVNDVDACYRLKLFLEQFSIGAAVLNAELPANSRQHILQQFNKGLFDYLIATDESLGEPDSESDSESDSDAESGAEGDETKDDGADDSDAGAADDDDSSNAESSDDGSDSGEESDEDAASSSGNDKSDGSSSDESGSQEDDSEDSAGEGEDVKAFAAAAAKAAKSAEKKAAAKRAKKKRREDRKFARDGDFGVARGIDFKAVNTVVNVDFPETVNSYTHRVGRTARGGASGAALSFVDPKTHAEALLKVQNSQPQDAEGNSQPSELPFDIREVYSFKYRVDNVKQTITRKAIKEARLAELKQEMINSERLRAHFEDNPRDLQVLRHDRALRPSEVQPALATVPDYLVPESLKAAAAAAKDSAGAGAWAEDDEMDVGRVGRGRGGRRPKKRRRGADPLKTFAINAAAFGAMNARHNKGKFSTRKRKQRRQFYRT